MSSTSLKSSRYTWSALITSRTSGSAAAIWSRMRKSSSAFPRAKPSSSRLPVPSCGISSRSPSWLRSRSQGRPLETSSSRVEPWNCTDSHTWVMPLWVRLESGKSTSWKTPANGSAGLARSRVSTSIRPPAPPAWIRARTRDLGIAARSVERRAVGAHHRHRRVGRQRPGPRVTALLAEHRHHPRAAGGTGRGHEIQLHAAGVPATALPQPYRRSAAVNGVLRVASRLRAPRSAWRPAPRAVRRPTTRPLRRSRPAPGRPARPCCRSARRSWCRWSGPR